jgi:SAM-dependent methyltransferase
MLLVRIIRLVRSLGLVNTISLLGDRILKRKSPAFLERRSVFQGLGLEVGGPSKVFSSKGYFPVYTTAQRIDNVNFRDVTAWHGVMVDGDNFMFDPDKPPGRQYIGDARDLFSIPDSSYDFVLLSHMLEHSANPLKVLFTCKRVLKDKGIIMLVLPHKEGTFDHKRPITTPEHFKDDLQIGTGEDDTTHINEILSLHDLARDPSQASYLDFKEWISDNFHNRGAHHHVFSSLSAAKLLNLAEFELIDVEPKRPYNIFLIAKKTAFPNLHRNQEFLRPDARYLVRSPFLTDRQGLG